MWGCEVVGVSGRNAMESFRDAGEGDDREEFGRSKHEADVRDKTNDRKVRSNQGL